MLALTANNEYLPKKTEPKSGIVGYIVLTQSKNHEIDPSVEQIHNPLQRVNSKAAIAYFGIFKKYFLDFIYIKKCNQLFYWLKAFDCDCALRYKI